ncbi:hydroxyacylglutathione hydrolase [Chamaesiphon sp. OTE_20_metabat_361]|uniref:hydroxyacylglutathione hydrolase n=1 Tax=Chamaesiphon sp. OTE_20_metabat_361 TaxID=2964689 RepID=UPI00286D534B|nr:hydroxyacylglutathione hydrolase [Chamaesiphon sp. OTE_20_metabat_361]
MEIIQIPVLSDNYIFLMLDREQKIAAVVDPAEAAPVLAELHRQQVELVAIFNTHHHGDHVGGNKELIAAYPNLRVYGGAEDRGRIPGQQVYLVDGDRVEFGERVGEVFFIPGHTRAHIAYYFPSVENDVPGELFCGDTIFAGGCGRLFEGTPAQMVGSITKLRQLPDNTRIWCAHEYTLSNLKFAVTVDPDNQELQQRLVSVTAERERLIPTVPTNLGLEKRTNPFLRWDTAALQASVGSHDAIETFARIRGRKDQF